MTVTLEIPSEIEAVLSAKTEVQGLALPDYLLSLCEADADEDYSLSAEDIESIQQGLEELHAGDKGISLEEVHSKMMTAISRL